MTQAVADPYAPPLTLEKDQLPSSMDLMREIVLGWEKLRLIYNGVLLVLGLIVIGILLRYAPTIGFVFILTGSMMAAIGANICFFGGPLVEVYFCALSGKVKVPAVRWVLFGGGLIVSVIVFVSACALMVGLE